MQVGREERVAEDCRDKPAVESERLQGRLAEGIFLKLRSGWGRLRGIVGYLAWRGWVTMLMLVMPACLTASMTEAKAPKGTFSSARR